MSRNCRFAVAVHVASVLAIHDDKPATSEWIAGSVNTNPVVVRRILSALGKAGLVSSIKGSAGGSTLARRPDAITLLDISRAVEDEDGPALHNQPPNPACLVGRGIQAVLVRILERADAARDAVLGGVLLSDVVADIRDEDIRGGAG